MATGDAIWSPANWEAALGANMDDYYTPEQQFSQFSTGIRPQWQYRAPLADVQERLKSRYLLGAPSSGGASFRDYLGTTGPGNYAQDYATLGTRARLASNIANLTPQKLSEQYNPGDAGFNQAAWYRQMYGQPSGESLANQRGLVNLLARQRSQAEGGGEWGGRMGRSIDNMLSELYQARSATGNPGSSFLSWYLDQTGR